MASLNLMNATNFAVRNIMHDDSINWLGEILIVKTLESGRVMNMSNDDLKLIPDIIKWYSIDHFISLRLRAQTILGYWLMGVNGTTIKYTSIYLFGCMYIRSRD